jgi:hypothetical protein
MHTRMTLAVAAQRARRSLREQVTIETCIAAERPAQHSTRPLLLLWITDNLAISKKIREERGGVVQVFAKSVGHQVVNDAVQRVMESQQLLGECDL